jgi:hypothetical protein
VNATRRDIQYQTLTRERVTLTRERHTLLIFNIGG